MTYRANRGRRDVRIEIKSFDTAQVLLAGFAVERNELRKHRIRPVADHVHVVASGEAKTIFGRDPIPEWRIGALFGVQLDWHTIVLIVAPVMGQVLMAQAAGDGRESLLEHLARFVERDAVIGQLVGRDAAADADLEAPAA